MTPNRIMSKFDAEAAIISIAQHASPNCICHNEERRAQLRRLSREVMKTFPFSKRLSSKPIQFFSQSTVQSDNWSLLGLLSHIGFYGGWTLNAWNLRPRFVPIKISLHPDVGISHEQDDQEHGHFKKAEKPEFTINEGPREKESDLHVKDQKDECHHIEAHIESHPRITNRLLSALIRCELSRIWATRAKKPRCKESADDEESANDQKDEDFAKLCEHRDARRGKIGEQKCKKVVPI
jgi:hypothetical protein